MSVSVVEDLCHKCQQHIGQDPMPELVQLFVDPLGWAMQPERSVGTVCTECQLATDDGAIDAILAMQHAPSHKFTPEILDNLLVDLGLAGKMVPDFGPTGVFIYLIAAVYQWRYRVKLLDICNAIAVMAGPDAEVRFLRLLAQHALMVNVRQLLDCGIVDDGAPEDTAFMADWSAAIVHPSEVSLFFVKLDERLNQGRFLNNSCASASVPDDGSEGMGV
ncbi:hypothetical protein GGR54DRAFT_650827 [Hypoxylon sp. NC1633]|nr:hypothetical protein GGR54DRAFT_650827 [Hypoxylon sp. NC1633]